MYGRKIFRPYVRQQYPFTQPSPFPHHKSWRTPNLTTRRICTGEKYFARARAIDAQSPTRFDRAPATRRRTTDVRAKNISPLRAPTISIHPTIKHRRTQNRGARPM